MQKCEAMTLGDTIPMSLQSEYTWKWYMEKIKYLGIEIPRNMESLYKLNYDRLETKIKQQMEFSPPISN